VRGSTAATARTSEPSRVVLITQNLNRSLLLVLLLAALSGCSSLPFFGDDDEPEVPESSEQELYRAAQRSLRASNYNDAIATNSLRLEELDSTTVSALSAKIESLNEQVPQNLTDELEAANKDIEALKAQINELETSVNAQDQALSVLVGAMQGLVGR